MSVQRKDGPGGAPQHPEARTTRSDQVANTSLAQPAHPSTRFTRGIALAQEHLEEVWMLPLETFRAKMRRMLREALREAV